MKQAGIYVNDDTEEMAMSFSVGGEKSGFDRNTFLTAFVESGISVARSEKMIEQMRKHIPKWKKLISYIARS